MKVVWSEDAWEDYLYWQDSDNDTLRRIKALIKDARRTPFEGLGKPEPLKNTLKGWWSRRITASHRLVYRVSGKGNEQAFEILSCRLHYS